MADAAILTEGLTKSYGASRGIEDVSFAVRRGEVFGFLGPNGAGKTTTIRVLLDLIRPTRGRAVVLGLDARRESRRIRERVGYLPGELAVYDRMSAGDFLRYAANLRGGRGADRAQALAERLRLDLSKPVRALSRGNKQKVGLVQAFMHDPDLLVLDEPTGGLDPLMQQEFNRMVREAAARGQTVFLSSHVLPEVEAVCDRVGIIREGRLVAVEDVAALKARAVRRLEVHFASPVPADEFAGVPGVRDVAARGSVVEGTVVGSLDAFVKAISRHEVVNVVTREPSLEDVFLSYYGERERS